jgi:hypothetical protein
LENIPDVKVRSPLFHVTNNLNQFYSNEKAAKCYCLVPLFFQGRKPNQIEDVNAEEKVVNMSNLTPFVNDDMLDGG